MTFRDAQRNRHSRTRRTVTIGAIVFAHVAAIWGLVQVRVVIQSPQSPVFVSLIAAFATRPQIQQAPSVPAQPARRSRAAPPPIPAPTPAVETISVASASAREVVLAAAHAPPASAPAADAPAPAASTLVPAPAPAPKIIAASDVQYLDPPVLQYPGVSRRLGETGRVLIRVFIDEAGIARQLQVNRSSGHPRLDDAALAAIQNARFKPYSEHGQPVAGWAFIPLQFELER